MSRPWQCIDERPSFAGYLDARQRRYLMPDGGIATWDILAGGRTVALVALTEDDNVVLVRQFRPGPGRILLEIPGGQVAEHETPVQAAGRELREETGYAAGQLTLVGHTWLASYATTQRYAVLATRCRRVGSPNPDPEEFGETVLLSRDAFVKHVRTGNLTDTDIAYMCLDWMTRHAS